MISGELISAQDAFEYGLVNKVVPESKLDEAVIDIGCKIKAKSRSVVAHGKQFYYKQIDLCYADAYQQGIDNMVECLNSKDGKEGLKSFIEKRPAKWLHE